MKYPYFDKPLTATKLRKDLWKVEREFTFFIDAKKTITVPRAFVTDLASVPWAGRLFIPKDGTHSQAAVLHDWLYEKAGEVEITLTRKEVDKLFLDAMGVLGVVAWKRRIMYRAVRIGGWVYFNQQGKGR